MAKAIDETRVSSGTMVTRLAPSWSPGSVSVIPNTTLLTSQMTKRPDTIYNTPNEWGFRTMSPWFRRWMQIASPLYRYSTKPKPGKTGWLRLDGSTANVAAAMLNYSSDPGDQLSNLSRLRPSGGLQVSISNAAKTRILSRVSQKKWDLGVFALEFGETVELATSLTKDVAKAYRKIAPDPSSFTEGWKRAVKRFDKALDDQKSLKQLGRKESDILERFADRWMEYTFGIKPTLYDVSDACSVLDGQIGRPLLAFAKAGASREERRREITYPHNSDHAVIYDVVCNYAEHYVLLYESSTEGVSPLTTLGLDNPYSVLWEKLPYSWMIDYVLGVGDWLGSWTAVQGLRLRSGCHTTIWRGHTEIVDVQLGDPDMMWDRRPQPLLNFSGGEMDRSLLSAFPTPAIAPNLKSSVGGFQLANSLFALRNLVHPGFKR